MTRIMRMIGTIERLSFLWKGVLIGVLGMCGLWLVMLAPNDLLAIFGGIVMVFASGFFLSDAHQAEKKESRL